LNICPFPPPGITQHLTVVIPIDKPLLTGMNTLHEKIILWYELSILNRK